MSKTFKGAGIVWHHGKMVARFVDGTCTTDDEETIKILEQMGYWCLSDSEQKTEEPAGVTPQKTSKSKKTAAAVEPDIAEQGQES